VQAIVQTGDGKVYQGIILEENPDVLVLKDAEGHVTKIPRDEDDVIKKGGSLMPKGLANLMTKADFLDLARFVSELGKAGPYSVRSTPTVQRWRVLTKVPAVLAEAVPDAATLKSEVLDRTADDWSRAYAKVAGMLPLAELTALVGGKVLYLQANVDVTVAGPIGIKVDSAEGVRVWIDDQPFEPGADSATEMALGQHRLILRVDTAQRPAQEIKVELFRPDASPAEFTVVGGP
jgi:hypothetical protein